MVSEMWFKGGLTCSMVVMDDKGPSVRPLSVYSMGDKSSDEIKLSPMRKKN